MRLRLPFNLRLSRFPSVWVSAAWFIISATVILAAGSYIFASDKTENANMMHLSVHSQPMGFTSDFLKIPLTVDEKIEQPWHAFLTGYMPEFEEIAISSLTETNGKPSYVPYDSSGDSLPAVEINHELLSTLSLSQIQDRYVETKTFILGTDKYGRDLYSRLLVGARISISIGIIAVLISLLIGISMGSIAGYYGGKVDAFVMYIINVTWSIPTLLMVIAISLALGKGYFSVFVAVGLTMWVEVARVVRGQVLQVKNNAYITAAKVLGINDSQIIIRHILPNITAPLIVISAANFASAILIESGLSFLGLGAQPPVPSWGSMIKDHYQYIILDKAHLAIIPGVAIMLIVISFMLLGNSLRDKWDVKNL